MPALTIDEGLLRQTLAQLEDVIAEVCSLAKTGNTSVYEPV
jgi:hypothetical protein